MREQTTDLRIEAASVTDRGLNEKRPLNEDSFLADRERRIFAVADGVGGSEAGEVASQTAIEVLDEAFRFHQQQDDDIEDLMEIAIQRANSSIHQMSREHPKFSMMATTIVALQLNGRRATIGHVGDSRLYRLAPDGNLHRETEDHSVIEEEVRAGRMTPEQAVNHPSRNVISRALGAEASVEVDLKTIEVEEGTVFLLCTDGITRHITDHEIQAILNETPNLDAACAEMKRRCYERGAEDNLTAVLVRVGERSSRFISGGSSVDGDDWDDERTIVPERFNGSSSHASDGALFSEAAKSSPTIERIDSSRHAQAPVSRPSYTGPMNRTSRSSNSSPLLMLTALLFVMAASAVAFYGGMKYQQWSASRNQTITASTGPTPTIAPTTTPESSEARYERLRRQVDRAPAAEALRMESETNGQPLSSSNPEFLYLYGRALLLSGKPQDAVKAFEASLAKINETMTPENGQLKIETKLAHITALLRAKDYWGARNAAEALNEVIQTGDK